MGNNPSQSSSSRADVDSRKRLHTPAPLKPLSVGSKACVHRRSAASQNVGAVRIGETFQPDTIVVGNAIIETFLTRKTSIASRFNTVQNILASISVQELGTLIRYVLRDDRVLNGVWLFVTLMLFESGNKDVSNQFARALRGHVLWRFSTTNTAQASLYSFFTPANTQLLDLSSEELRLLEENKKIRPGMPTESRVLVDFLFREGLLPSDTLDITQFYIQWNWLQRAHPLAMHMRIMTKLMGVDRWNEEDGTKLILVRGSVNVESPTVAIAGTQLFALGERVSEGRFGAVFKLPLLEQDTGIVVTESGKRGRSEEETDTFVLKVSNWKNRANQVLNELEGSKLALACSWLSFMVNAATISMSFAQRDLNIESSDENTEVTMMDIPVLFQETQGSGQFRFALLMNDVGTLVFEDVAIDAFADIVTQVFLAAAAFHRYTKHVHHDLAPQNVVLRDGRDYLAQTGIAVIRYLVSTTEAHMEQDERHTSEGEVQTQAEPGSRVISQPLFNIDRVVVTEAMNAARDEDESRVMVVDVAVRDTAFASLIDWGLHTSITTAILISSNTLGDQLTDHLLGSRGSARAFTPLAAAMGLDRQANMTASLRVIFDDARTLMQTTTEEVFLSGSVPLSIFENTEALEQLLRTLPDNTRQIALLKSGGVEAYVETIKEHDDVLGVDAHVRVLQGLLIERIFVDSVPGHLIGIDAVCHDFVPFTLATIRKLRANVNLKLGALAQADNREAREVAVFEAVIPMIVRLYAALGCCFAFSLIPLMKKTAISATREAAEHGLAFGEDGGLHVVAPAMLQTFSFKMQLSDKIRGHMESFGWRDEFHVLQHAIGYISGSMSDVIALDDVAASALENAHMRVANMVTASEQGFHQVASAANNMPTYELGARVEAVARRKQKKRRKTTASATVGVGLPAGFGSTRQHMQDAYNGIPYSQTMCSDLEAKIAERAQFYREKKEWGEIADRVSRMWL